MAGRIFLPSLILGFHGCDETVANRVLAGRQGLRPSENDYDWLGSGIYFWEGDPKRAMEWALDLKRRGKIRRPAVVGAVIEPGYCLNLFDRADLEQVRVAYQQLVSVSGQAGVPVPENRGVKGRFDLLFRNLDCATINLCRQSRVERGLTTFDTVRSSFVEGEPLYPNAGFNDRNHIQLCVVNPACIKGYFRPLPGDAV